jgi:hypothetical protein
MDPGMVGGVVGGVLGLAGGAIGTYFSIRNTAGPRERRFMVRAAIVAWLAITAFVVALYLLPSPYRWLLWVPYGIGLGLGIPWCNRRQARIRSEEAAAR